MNETTQQEKTTQLGSRDETTKLGSRKETPQLVSRNETTQLRNETSRRPPTTTCTAFLAESAFSTYCQKSKSLNPEMSGRWSQKNFGQSGIFHCALVQWTGNTHTNKTPISFKSNIQKLQGIFQHRAVGPCRCQFKIFVR
ncbi:hypothetical protein TNCV_4973831 [Trichonephila clavipes]|uniref:Uncharacterized protein n=1 Tax=Trichonephila clavipes TaxID=2585209 RepID=A0A8X6SRY1_TRICX|nr:hypothetical protein TNCV_4973831 [Trichonephila clavipes]